MKNKTKSKLYLKPPGWKWLALGGVASCTLPVIIGLIILQADMSHGDAELLMPIGLTFVFGSTFTAWVGCFIVYMGDDKGFGGTHIFVGIAIKTATIVQFCAGVLHILLIEGQWLEAIGLMLTFGLIIHIPLWLCITLPLSILCGWIFRQVAMDERTQA